MKTIKELKEEIKSHKLHKLPTFLHISQAQLKQTEDILKLIDGEIKKEEECMEQDTYQEQIEEHTFFIEAYNRIKSKITGEK